MKYSPRRFVALLLALVMVLSLAPLDAVASIFTSYEANIVIDTSDPVQISEAVVTSKVTSLDGFSAVVSSIDDILPAKGWVDFSPETPKAGAKKAGNRGPEEKASGAKDPELRTTDAVTEPDPVPARREIGRYNITVYDANEKEWQPNPGETVDVRVRLSSPVSVNPGASLTLVHDPDGNPETVQATFYKNTEGQLTGFAFEAGGFSVYAVEEETENNTRINVKFMDGETERATLTVKKSDTFDGADPDYSRVLYDPGVNELQASEVFRGWYKDDPDTLLTIADIRDEIKTMFEGDVTDGETVTYHAAVSKIIMVTYLNEKGTSLGSYSEEVPRDTEGNISSIDYTVNMTYTPADTTHDFDGWYVTEGLGNIIDPDNITETTVLANGTGITITGDVVFSVSCPEGHWLVFNENGKGATYNAPQFVKHNEVTHEPPLAMERNGYQFGGWYTDAACTAGNEFTFGGSLSDNKEIYAKWIANTTAGYTIIFRTQNAGRTGYDIKESVYIENGTVGQNIPYTFVNNQDEDYVKDANGKEYHYTGFCLKEAHQNKQVVITPEGDAILELDFDRIEYNFRFYIYRKDGGSYRCANGSAATTSQDNIWDLASWHQGSGLANMPDTSYGEVLNDPSNNGYYFVMEAYYGEDITNKWPQYSQITGQTDVNNRNPVSFIMMLGTKLKTVGTGTGADTIKGKVTRMDENILGKTNDKNGNFVIVRFNTYNVWTYNIYVEIPQGGQAPDGAQTRVCPQNGKTYYLLEPVSSRSTNQDPGQQNAPPYEGYVSVKGSDPQKAYYDTNGTCNLNYYYDRLSYPIAYRDGVYINGNNLVITDITKKHYPESAPIEYGMVIPDQYKNYEPAAPEGFVFEGWYVDETCQNKYTFNTMPIDGITVYAKWRQVQYRVFLDPDVPESDESLTWGSESQAMNFRVNYGGSVSVPTGLRDDYELVGWYSQGAAFSEKTRIYDSNTVPYDKSRDFTEGMNKYGKGATSNGDLNRDWITRKLVLKAVWRAKIPGALGITVEYDPTDNEGNTGSNPPTDSRLYVDSAKAPAQGSCTPPEGKVFSNWVLQTWNGTAYVDTSTKVFPGESFTVLKSDAKTLVTQWVNPNNENDIYTVSNPDPGDTPPDGTHTKIKEASYTVRLRAEYKDPIETPKTTIIWYSNYGTENGGKGIIYRTDSDIDVNKTVGILGPQPRPGYIFKGWTQSQGGTTPSLVYASGKFTSNGKIVSNIAPDGSKDVEELFAVWEENIVTINYAVADDSTGMGTVDPESETLNAELGTAEGSVATPGELYAFRYWTCDDGTDPVSTDAAFVPSKNNNGLYEEHTYYAHFEKDKAYYDVEFYYQDENLVYQKVGSLTDTRIGTIGTEVSATDEDKAKTTYEGETYTLNTTESTLSATLAETGTVLKLKFDRVVNAELTVEKSASPATGVKAGDTVIYTVVVTNSGNVTVKDIALIDTLVTLSEAAFTLAPEETKTVTYEYTVTQADVDAGKIDNTATAKGKDPKGNEVKDSDDAEVTTVEAAPALTVTKTASPASGVKAGDEVTYTVVVTNSGNVTVKDIAMTDTLVTLSEAAFTLAPEGTKTITYEYTVTQADVDAGKIDNTVTAKGKDPKNNDVTGTATATVTTVDAAPALTVTKTASPASGVKAGDEVTYTVVVTNSGNVTVKDIALTDTLVTLGEAAFTLAPEGTKTITYTYTVTQADVDAGKIDNTVTAKGKDPKNNDVTGTATATVTTVDAAPALTVTKSASPASGVKAGDTVTYTVVVTNSGNVTVKDIALTDTLVTLSEAAFELAPAGTKTITYTYTVTQANVDAGKIDNTVTAKGKDPKGDDVTGTATATVTTVDAAPALTVTKSASPASGVKAGDEVTYTVVVTNSGNVTVKDIAMTDTLVSLSEAAFTLAPAGTKTITYTYTVTQADVDAGKIDNTVTAKGKDPKNNDVTGTATATVTTVDAAPALTVTKSASPASGVKAGDTVTYTVVVTNSGNVTVKDIAMTDTLVTLSEAAFTLAPAGSKTITYEYTVTQADVDAGKIDNTATAKGKDPKGNEVKDSDDAEVTTVAADPALTVTKSASPASGVKAGDEVTYTVVVTNSGNVTVKDIAMTDTLVSLSEAAFTLAPAGTKTITYTYTVTQADVDAGKIDNTVTAKGKDPKNNDVTGTATATVTTVAADPKLTVEKTANPESGVEAGDEVVYTVVVTNSGNVTVSDITMTDTLVTLSETAFTLAPAGTKTITYTYTVTQADVDAGKIDNTVTAKGKDPKNNDVTGTATATVTTVETDADLTVTKTASPASGVKAGDTVTYTVVVTNSGNVTVKDIALTDTLVTLGEAAFDLAPAGTKTITYTYTVTQADVDAGKIDNTVTAKGKDPKNNDVTDTATATVTTVAADPKLTVEKTANPESGVEAGDEVVYTVVVTNSGNVTVSDITMTDTLVTLSETAFTLAPAGTKTITYTYTVTQTDVDAGKIDNTATAKGKDPKGAEVKASDDAVVTTVDAAAELSITKEADPTEGVAVGDTIEYTVVVENIGNVSVTDGVLEDDHADLSGETFALAPGETAEFTYTYEVTQDDVDAGSVVNVVTANATAVRGDDPEEVEDTATVTTEDAAAELSITKEASPASGVKAGDTVNYTVTVTNTGNVTVEDGTLEDDHADLSGETFELAPGEKATFTYTYKATQADIDAGEIVNVVTANAVAARGDNPEEVEATATVTTVAADAALTVEKTANPASGVKAGDKVTYTVVVTNSGNVTVKDIAMTDTLVTLSEDAFTLAPEGTKTITYEYTVTQADVDAGKIDNTATAAGKDPKDKEVTDSDDAKVTTVAADAALTVEKSASPASGVKAGDKVTYTVVVTNSGNVTVSSIEMEDTLVTLTEAAFELAPEGTKTITYEYTVTQADVDAGKIDNTATATGKDPKDAEVTDSDDAEVTTVAADPKLTVEKTAEPESGVKAGDKVTYTVVVTNSGNVTVKDIALTDTLVTLEEDAFTLAPEEAKTVTYEYTVTQADVDAGKIDNTATAIGEDPKGGEVKDSDDAEVTTVEAKAELTVDKTAEPESGVKVGDKVAYTVVVTNSGNVTVTGIAMSDSLVTLTEEVFDLAPAGTKTITYEYTVTQADVDAGKIDNTATAVGKDPKGAEVKDSDDAEVTTVEAAPELTVDKSASPASGVKVGDKVTYTVVVTNSGNVTVTGIAMSDSLVTLSTAAFDLAPAGAKTITYEYTVTQADVDAGKIDNTATATGKDPKDAEVTDSDDAEVTTVEAAPELTVDKSASPASDVKAGDKVTYTVVVTNSGNVTVKDIVMTDTLVTLSEAAFTLAPEGTRTITYEYTVTQADVDAGKIDNTATAAGTDPKGTAVTASDDAEVTTVAADAELTVEKTASPTSGVKAGDKVTYTVVVTNSGNVTVKDISMTDTLVTLDEDAFTLAPEGTKTITYEYTVTQADVDAGKIDNTATAAGKDPKDNEITASDDAEVTTVEAKAAIEVTKTSEDSDVKAGDTVIYTITVENTGNVTVSGLTLTDILEGIELGTLDKTTIAPGETATAAATYTVTQADVDAGKIDNTATATGKDPKNKEVTDDDDCTVTTVEAAPALTVEKTANPASGVKAGDKVTYTVVVTNSGNVTVKDIAMTDTLVTLNETAFTLAPAGTKTITYEYMVTQADVDAGKIDNTATATGKDPKDKEVTASDDAEVTTVEAAPELTVDKSASPASGVKVGDKVTYTVVVTNSGNVTVKEIAMTDTLVTLNVAAFTLAPEGSKTITYEYTVTQADVDAGKIDNTATAKGKDPKGSEVKASDDAEVTTVEAAPELTVDKSASPASGVKVGDKVTYTVVVTNSGNVTVKEIAMTDTLVTLSEAAFTLAPEGTKTITYEYTVTQADVDAGKIDNTATATGTDPKDKEVTASDDAEVTTVEAAPELTVDKSASPASGVKVGDKVTYTVVVTNSGNVTVKDIAMTDTLVTLSEAAFTLAPAGSKTITYEYTVTQADVDAGKIDNTATATGTDPKDKEVTASDDAEVTTVAAKAELSITKAADPTEGVEVGDTVTYTVVVKNTGNVSVKAGKLVDDHADLSGKTFALAPDEEATFTYTYTVTQDDFDAGKIVNTVKANATAVRGSNPAEVSANATVTAAAAEAKLGITKEASPNTNVKLGDVITYTVVVKNEGNVSVKEGKLTDTLADLSDKTFALAPGEEATFTYTYKVTQDDVDAGEFVNVVTANAKSVREDDPEEVTATATVTAEQIGSIDVEKTTTSTPANGETYALGEKITYEITVKNNGTVTVTAITVTDDLTGDTWTIDTLAPGASKKFTAEYTVTEDDIMADTVVNKAKAGGTSPDPEHPDPGDEDEVEDPTDDPNASLKVTKKTTSTPADGKAYALGETITYEITVKNNGNLTLTNVVVTDEKTGDEWTVETMAPGDDATFTAEHTVTEADILAGSVVNDVTATGNPPDDDIPDPKDDDEVEDPTEDPNPHLTIEKTTTSKPKDPKGYAEGETITYKLTVTNDGNLTIERYVVTDKLTGFEEVVTESLAPGASKSFETSYVVTAKDVKRGYVLNKATVKGDNPVDEDDPPVKDGDEEKNPTVGYYKLTVEYVYQDGREAAETYTEEKLSAGDKYSVTSPTIPGYHPSVKIVQGTMPKRDVTVTVIYLPNQEIIPIDDFVTPLGLGLGGVNAGETIE